MAGKLINLLVFVSIWLFLAFILTVPLVSYSKVLGLDNYLSKFDYGDVKSLSPEESALLGVGMPAHKLENRFYLGVILSLPLAYFLFKRVNRFKKTKILIVVLGGLTVGILLLVNSDLNLSLYSEDMEPGFGDCSILCVFY